MAGVVGLVQRSAAERASRVEEMLSAATDRLDQGQRNCFSSDLLGISMGWSGDAGTLRWNERKDVGIYLRGELFPDPEKYDGLLRSYEKSGEAFFEGLNGRFSGVLLDLRQQKVVLFNDRYGLGRIYYHESGERFFFASEAKALLRILPETRSLDERGLAEFCSCGCVLQNRTLFRGIAILPGAAKWTFTADGPLQKESYFARETWEAQLPLSEEDFYENLKQTFAEILPGYLAGPQPLGMSLTGGLDGRMIMAWAKSEPGTLPCYTFGGSYRECADVTLARQVAEVCQQTHSIIPVGEDFLREFPRLAEETVRVSDGAMDVTGAVEGYVNRAAKGIAPIRLTGSYGSEVLRGNVAFEPQSLREDLYTKEFLCLGREAAVTYEQEAAVPRQSFIAFKQVPWHHYARLAVEESQLTIRTPFLDNALVALSYRAPESVRASAVPSLRLIAAGNRLLGAIPTDRGLSHSSGLGAQVLHAFERFWFKAEYAYDYGMPQWLAGLDHRLAWLHLERLFLGHHKFYHFRVWYRDQLAGYVRDVLLDSGARGRSYLRSGRVEAMVLKHVRGEGNYTTEISQMLTLELIHQQLLERN